MPQEVAHLIIRAGHLETATLVGLVALVKRAVAIGRRGGASQPVAIWTWWIVSL
jgi:hypothetical protein